MIKAKLGACSICPPGDERGTQYYFPAAIFPTSVVTCILVATQFAFTFSQEAFMRSYKSPVTLYVRAVHAENDRIKGLYYSPYPHSLRWYYRALSTVVKNIIYHGHEYLIYRKGEPPSQIYAVRGQHHWHLRTAPGGPSLEHLPYIKPSVSRWMRFESVRRRLSHLIEERHNQNHLMRLFPRWQTLS